ncbi:alkaline phosphatase [Barnesiella sp. WM24]|uniref:alkaline phosphatase n=1 Tax=Barnesiella sp. WM24 TaxID=2558278 RepID=UPI001072DF71|nr:alkaline phosphatase [Barnesiella sp. WM24]MDE6114403.1 alkaline phosphatase [Muribaculum sp.]TFU91901.1 alkaline phosphatase [Barnesiella sp. WM24]
MKLHRILATVLTGLCVLGVSAEVKYVFYLIGDGMGMGHVNAAQYYNRIVRGADEPLLMMQFPVASQAWTYSASAPVTDSAAAGTALSTGYKTKNNMLGLAPDSVEHYVSIARDLKDAGWGVGVLTSVAPDDATPAAFYAHQPARWMYYEIDKEAVASGYDFLGGASLRGVADKEGKPNEVPAMIKDAGIEIAYGTEAGSELAGKVDRLWVLSPENVWGNGNNIGYTIDSIPGAMNLPSLTKVALDHVSAKSPDKFFMMIEGGNIDHAAHANDPGGVIKEVLNFQDVIRVAYDFYLAHPEETLIVITADHDTGGMAIGHPDHYGYVDLALVDTQRISKDRLADYCRDIVKDGKTISWDEMRDLLQSKLGFWTAVPLTEEQTNRLRAAFDRTFLARESNDEKGLYNTFSEFVIEAFRIYNYWVGTDFISHNHTANPVPVFAIGNGSEKFTHVVNNTDIPRIIRSLTLGE